MKIVCEKEKLIKAINSVVKGVSSKTTMPILEGILIQTNENKLKLTTYDLEIGIEYVIDCEIQEEGSTVVNAIMFSEIIRKLPNTEIHIHLNEKNLLVIECEGSLYKLATMNPEEFPELPKIDIDNSIEIEQNKFIYGEERSFEHIFIIKNSVFPFLDTISINYEKLKTLFLNAINFDGKLIFKKENLDFRTRQIHRQINTLFPL